MHIRFEDEGEAAERQASGAAASCAPPLQQCGVAAWRCAASTRVDFDQQDRCYVLELVSQPSQGLVAARLSNRRIKLFSLGNGSLQFAGELAGGHSGAIRDAQFCLPDQPALLHSCGADGLVLGWDARSGQAAERYAAPRADLLSCTTNGALVAAGGGDRVLFWDRRSSRPLASFDDTHAQEVVAVRFHPVHRGMLVSASEDGLVAVFDTAPQLDEDEGFKAALNIDTAPARLGFYGPSGGLKLWCASATETLHLWEWAAACDDGAEGGSGPLASALDTRAQLTAAAAAAGPGAAPLAPELDYLIGCEYSEASDQLWVLAGNNAGVVGFFPVLEPPTAAAAAAAATPGATLFGSPAAVLTGGHDDIVRSVLWPGAGGSLCLSGGEDSKVCTWSLAPTAAAAAGSSGHARPAGSSGSEGAVRRQPQHVRRSTPY